MPAKGRLLGFSCPNPKCKRQYGFIEVIRINSKSLPDHKDVTDSEGNFLKKIETKRRPNLKPVESAWKRQIEYRTEYNRITKALNSILNIDWSKIPNSPQKEQCLIHTYENLVQFRANLKERMKEFEQEDLRDANWNVYDEDGKVKWNPVKLLKRYNEIGDWFSTVSLPYEFYAKIKRKHPYAINDYLTKEEWNFMQKGHEIYAKYSEPFYNKNWRYTWYEWFIIIEYAEETSYRKAAKMLAALGDERKPPSVKHIKDNISSVREFGREFYKYIPGFFHFIFHMIAIAKNDPELKQELDEITEKRRHNVKDYEQEISNKFITNNQIHLTESGETFTNDHIGVNSESIAYIKTNDTDVIKMENGIILIGNERIKIHHPNKNYSKEKIEYNKRLQDAELKNLTDSELQKIKATKPKRRISCGPFHPSRLPINVLEQLCKEGKIQT